MSMPLLYSMRSPAWKTAGMSPHTMPTVMPANALPRLPFSGIRGVKFSHTVMGPTCDMELADLGAEAIKIEPFSGDSTRNLLGSGASFFYHV